MGLQKPCTPANADMGGVKPMSSTTACTLKIRGGCERDCYGKKAGKGALIQWELSGTLGVSQDQTLFVWHTDSQQKATERSSYRGRNT